MESLQVEIVNLVILVIAGAVGFITKQITSYLNKKGVLSQINGNKEIVKIVVNAIEQTYKTLDGKEKFELAKMEILTMAKAKGLKITEKELDLLIEHSVKEMKNGVKEGSKPSQK